MSLAMTTPCPACGLGCQRLDPATKWPQFVAEHLDAIGLSAPGPMVLGPRGGVLAHAFMLHTDEELALVLST